VDPGVTYAQDTWVTYIPLRTSKELVMVGLNTPGFDYHLKRLVVVVAWIKVRQPTQVVQYDLVRKRKVSITVNIVRSFPAIDLKQG